MPFHCAAYSESLDPAGLSVNVAAVADDLLTVAGDDIIVPASFRQIIGFGASVADGTVDPQARLESPSLRGLYFPDIAPISEAASWESPPPIHVFGETPISLVTNEALQATMLSNPAAAVEHNVIVLLAEAAINPTKLLTRTVRATAAIAQAANTWTSGALTFSQNLPSGTYGVAGLRVLAATGIWARLLPVGGGLRPGAPVTTTVDGVDHPAFRRGGLGQWFTFDTTQPPQLEVLGGAAVAQEVFLDLVEIQRRAA